MRTSWNNEIGNQLNRTGRYRVMDPKRWNKPVTFQTGKIGQYRTIDSTSEAAFTLMNQWPTDSGEKLTRAKMICLAVLEGREEPDKARNAFLKAAEEAHVFVRDK
jgi:hypothetical protein